MSSQTQPHPSSTQTSVSDRFRPIRYKKIYFSSLTFFWPRSANWWEKLTNPVFLPLTTRSGPKGRNFFFSPQRYILTSRSTASQGMVPRQIQSNPTRISRETWNRLQILAPLRQISGETAQTAQLPHRRYGAFQKADIFFFTFTIFFHISRFTASQVMVPRQLNSNPTRIFQAMSKRFQILASIRQFSGETAQTA